METKLFKTLKHIVVLLLLISVMIIAYNTITDKGNNEEAKLNKEIAIKDSIINVYKSDMVFRDSLIKEYKDSMIFYISMIDSFSKQNEQQNNEDYEREHNGIINGSLDDNIKFFNSSTAEVID